MGGQVPKDPAPDHHIASLATLQHGVVSRKQLLRLGLSGRMIERRIEAGRLYPLHRGVYAVGHERLSTRSRWLAAVLTCGEHAVLSHRSAAALWGLARVHRGPIEVSSRRRRQGPGLRVRERRIGREDRAVRDSIPVTSVARTLIDLVGILDDRRFERTWEEADRLGLLELRTLEQSWSRARGRPGAGRIHDLIVAARDPVRTRSPLEDRFAVFCREQRFPRPSFNVLVLGHEVDALWPRQKLAVELDSFEFHGHRAAFERDRSRDMELQVAGYRVIRVTHRRLDGDSLTLAHEIRALLRRSLGTLDTHA
jgi:very-short-patch-repair endonuclease